MDTYLSYQIISRNMTRSIERIQSQPVVERETAYYLENIENIKSIDDFFEDDRIYQYAMKAHGLEDMAYAKAFIRKALTEGIQENDAFANQLTDKRFKDFVKVFNFEQFGADVTKDATVRQGTVDMYLRQTLEQDAGNSNEGVRLALYFERNVADLSSHYEILADRVLATVVRTALGLPESFATTDIDKQAAHLKKHIDLDDFKDPVKLEKFLQRFTAMYEMANPSTASAASSVAVLFSQPAEFGVSTNVLLALQSMRR
ncbi:DUF1217 domain-containing protein [Limoniibacter endophyticus]|uniref:DUF1217 domain-containing protein n=1 Tax=Limoniibacter endophyticus TaxID=1565040 RepID=A0A8J3DLK8_9HYPH|nr:DUF1217 domain-containing protein [Limoniibacter endophyticus]GHC64624.1 hypothetical protein GCM10010136_06700 [Limoniibacter endophyticus]